jgi:hypothetical protein
VVIFFNGAFLGLYVVKCLECYHLHQPEPGTEHYYCLKAEGIIMHEIDEDVTCDGFTPLTGNLEKNR